MHSCFFSKFIKLKQTNKQTLNVHHTEVAPMSSIWSPGLLSQVGEHPISSLVSHDALIPLPCLWYCFGKTHVLPWQRSASYSQCVIVVFHLQQEKDLFPSQTQFPRKHFTGMCARMCMCVLYVCSSQQSFDILLLEETNRWVVFFFWRMI